MRTWGRNWSRDDRVFIAGSRSQVPYRNRIIATVWEWYSSLIWVVIKQFCLFGLRIDSDFSVKPGWNSGANYREVSVVKLKFKRGKRSSGVPLVAV